MFRLLAKKTKIKYNEIKLIYAKLRDMKTKNICYVSDSDTLYDKYVT